MSLEESDGVVEPAGELAGTAAEAVGPLAAGFLMHKTTS